MYSERKYNVRRPILECFSIYGNEGHEDGRARREETQNDNKEIYSKKNKKGGPVRLICKEYVHVRNILYFSRRRKIERIGFEKKKKKERKKRKSYFIVRS